MARDMILLVEDDPNDILLMERCVQKANLRASIQVANSGETAVAYLSGQASYADRERHPIPALILLDLKLVGMSGFEVLAWLRRQPGLKRIPVVVLTSSTAGSDISRAYDLGANSYVIKPRLFNALLDMVKTLDQYWLTLNERPVIAAE